MNQRTRYLLLGVAFGCLFPILAIIIEIELSGIPFSLDTILDLHATNHLFWIIDTAPLFLGLFSYGIGLATDRLLKAQSEARAEIMSRKQKLRDYSRDLEKRNAELRELNNTLDGLVYTASHDLKTPLTNFQALISMLRTVIDQPGQEEIRTSVLDRMDIAVLKFEATIAGLLDVTRVEKDLEELEAISLEEALKEVTTSISEIIRQKRALISLDVAEAPIVWCTTRDLDSLLQNLISNALKYSHPDRVPEIQVRSCQEGQFTVVSVADNGMGIDIAKQGEKVFQMFTRLHVDVQGSGIGLYLVKRIMTRMGGQVVLESRINEGTTFKLYFPIPAA